MNSSSQSLTQSKANIQTVYQRLNLTPKALADFCERWQIAELAVFGSVLRKDFRTAGDNPSDIDFLYVSEPEARYGFRFFDMQTELAQLLGREIDLVSKRGVQNSLNPLRRKTILKSAQVIYAKRAAIGS